MTTDFARHNEEVRQVWEAFDAGDPIRVPMTMIVGSRIWVQDPSLNTEGVTFGDVLADPETMFQVQLNYQRHLRHHVWQDMEMGVPAAWPVAVEFHNVTEAAWLGCKLECLPGNCPATRHAYEGDRKEAIFERPMPGPFDGLFGTVREYYEYFVERASGYEFHGRPLEVAQPWVGLGTDGPLTLAFDLRGTELLEDMVVDEDYYHRLMDFLVTAAIDRVRVWREYLGVNPRPDGGGLADDAIQFISVETYVEKVLPYHKRLLAELYGDGPVDMHLCGDVQRHFPTLIRELGVRRFDTGFPIRFETLRDEVGEDVTIQGGVTVMDLLSRDPAWIADEARRILESGIMRGGRFVMIPANNLPPLVPEANLRALYEATRRFGRYR